MFFTNTDQHALQTREGLTAFLTAASAKPDTLNATELAALDPDALTTYNAARIRHISGGIVIDTPDVSAIRHEVTKVMYANSGQTTGRGGVMVSGAPSVGKTTAAKALMRWTFTQYLRAMGPLGTAVPIVYVEVGSGSTAKGLVTQFARFFGLTVTSSQTTDALVHKVVQALNAANTQLIVVDEVHNLGNRNQGNRDSIDLLKELHNKVRSTFVYAGIDLAKTELLSGIRGQQVSARFPLQELGSYGRANSQQRRQWKAFIDAYEPQLMLTQQEPGTLLAAEAQLWDATRGSIGSLTRLVVKASITAILDGTEYINADSIEAETVDLAAKTKRDAAARSRAA